MTRRRLLEILVAATVLVLLVTVILVRPTARRTEPPPAPLFHPVAGGIPDLSASGEGRITARSPEGGHTAILYPVEFEEPADLYVLTAPGQGVHFALADSVATELSPKNVGWIDAHTLWVTLGYRYGTVSPGGDLHLVDAATGRGRILWVTPDAGQTQAVAATPEPGGRWISVRLKVFDANMEDARDSTIRLPTGAPPRGDPTPGR